uniref:Uncharacterized protein n=1 Tax=Timema bartmani TaxID=61472 RepID=A0A7R9I5X2_9NEOP|nr:unnamed protein product [Timema bartmani]
MPRGRTVLKIVEGEEEIETNGSHARNVCKVLSLTSSLLGPPLDESSGPAQPLWPRQGPSGVITRDIPLRIAPAQLFTSVCWRQLARARDIVRRRTCSLGGAVSDPQVPGAWGNLSLVCRPTLNTPLLEGRAPGNPLVIP